MQSSKHIGAIVRNHADAIENGKAIARQRASRGKASSSSFADVTKHRAFVPMVTIWGGVFMALIMAVMPDYAIARSSALTGVYLPLIAVRVILAVGVGCAGALLGFIVSSALANYTMKRDGEGGIATKALKSRDFEPINPVADLGSESLDAPIMDDADAPEPEPELTLGELAERDYEIDEPAEFADASAHSDTDDDAQGWAFTRKHFKNALIESCEGATCEPAPNEEPAEPRVSQSTGAESADSGFASLDAVEITPQRKPLGDKREALDLSGFSAIAEEEEQEAPDAAPQQTPPPAPATALEALRQRPADELSLVEMVERFAAALHDRQAQERARFEHSQQSRDAALAEALKALTLFTENGFDAGATGPRPVSSAPASIDQTEGELRDALTRLQGIRGAA